ncbi:hypothetical protein [Streptomyces sp. PTD5-9]|uniref:hypothetical protein n=1 Tax=Streptomyces sp. PTD5-9 TaxID=3120150 RepID=UPI00300B7297
MITNFRLDRAGIAAVLKSNEMLDAVNGLAVEVAANARTRLPPRATVTFRPHITDRQRASVIVHGARPSPAAVLIQSARAVGLEVHEYPPQ